MLREKTVRISPGRNPDHGSADDASGASGASDIRLRDDSGGNGRHHSNMACIVGTPDLRKFEIHHLLAIGWALRQTIQALPIPRGNIFSYGPFS